MPHKSHPDYSKLICITAILGICLLAFRIFYTGHITYLFLIWNLFLAIIPYAIMKIVNRLRSHHFLKHFVDKKLLLIPMLLLWLLFLPNAPYMMTDFIHLTYNFNPLYYLDLLILISFSGCGIFLALDSINNAIKHLENIKWLPDPGTQIIFKLSVVFLCGFGIYLGRVERWNS